VSLAVFLVVALLVLALMHLYVWVRLVRDTRLARPWRRLAAVALLLLAIALPVVMSLLRRTPLADRHLLTLVAFSWLGLLFYLVLLLAALDLVRLVRAPFRRRAAAGAAPTAGARTGEAASAEAPSVGSPSASAPSTGEQPPTRRELLARVTAGVVVAGAGSTGLVGWRRSGELTSPEIPVRLARLPRELDGLRLVQITDVHLGLLLDRSFLRDVVERANALRPDAVVLTGDLVDGSVQTLGPELAPLAGLRSRWGSFFVTGNHEYYSGADEWVDFLRRGGVRVLLNERVELGDAARLDLAGVTDYRGGRSLPGHAPDLPRALAGRDPSRELVLLAHQPRHIDEAAAHEVGLQLSGHTHGGQMWPFGALVGLVQPYVRGLHRHGERTQIYVSCGAGFWGPPMRVAAPAEVGCIVLTT